MTKHKWGWTEVHKQPKKKRVKQKKTAKDAQYEEWLEERLNNPSKPVDKHIIAPVEGEALLHFRADKTVDIVLVDREKHIDEVGLMAIGIKLCLQDEAWTKRLIIKAHSHVTNFMKEKSNG